MHGSLQREDHLSRAVAWSLLQEPLQKLANMLVAAVKAIAELSDADMHAPQRALLHLPHRHGAFGIQRFEEDDVADASFPAAAALADMQWPGAHSASHPLLMLAPPLCVLSGSVCVSSTLRCALQMSWSRAFFLKGTEYRVP